MPRLRLAVLPLAAMLLAGACGAPAAPSSGAVASGGDPGQASAATDAPATSDAPAPTEAPPATDAPAPTEAPPATDAPAPTEEPQSTQRAATAAACSGSDANREFFDSIAHAVDWPVLCGVLPRGWFVSEGKYRLASGGWLRIGYKGPGGATLWLHQGAACSVNGGCSPSGPDLGGAALGPLDGTLHENGDGFAVLAAPGENPSWYLATSGLDQATTVELAGALAEAGR